MNSISIGKVIEVTNKSVMVAIDNEIVSSYVFNNGSPIRVGGVGSFLKIDNDIFEIINEKVTLDNTIVGSENQKAICNRVVYCVTLGFFEDGVYYQGSSGNSPSIFENAYTVTDEEIILIYSGTTSDKSIKIGKYLYEKNLDFYIDVDRFFASHVLIVGNTGSGKSNTVNKLYTELFEEIKTKDSYFLVVDTNGEYSKSFTSKKTIKYLNTRVPGNNTLKIPLSLLETEDWKLLLEATEKTQYPIIKTVWNSINKKIFAKGTNAKIGEFIIEELKRTITGILNSNSNASNKFGSIISIKDDLTFIQDEFYKQLFDFFVPFDNVTVNGNKLIRDNIYQDEATKIIDEINTICFENNKNNFTVTDFGFILSLEHLYRTYKWNTNESNTSPLIARFNSNKKDFNNIFTEYNLNTSESILNVLYDSNNILICDVSKARKDIRRIIVTFICSKLYNYFCDYRGSKTSLHLIVDEAHNYLSSQSTNNEDAIAKTCIETFESIIKEGRKYGVFLTMSTQRPSDITSTLLSQSHNYIIHKLVNPKDIDIIKNTVPFIDEMSIKMLSILAPGQAIFSGTAFNRPNIVKIKVEDLRTRVESDTVKLMKIWKNKNLKRKAN